MSTKVGVNTVRVGNVLEHEGKLWVVRKTEITKPGKGGAFMQVEMKNLRDGTKQNIRFRTEETVIRAFLETIDFQFMYLKDNTISMINIETFEQVDASIESLNADKRLLEEGMKLKVDFYDSNPIAISLPETVVCKVDYAEPVVKGQTATSSYKPATLENEIKVMVPPFIEAGDSIIIKSETLEYVERAK